MGVNIAQPFFYSLAGQVVRYFYLKTFLKILSANLMKGHDRAVGSEMKYCCQ